jgi:hypothetical protein
MIALESQRRAGCPAPDQGRAFRDSGEGRATERKLKGFAQADDPDHAPRKRPAA